MDEARKEAMAAVLTLTLNSGPRLPCSTSPWQYRLLVSDSDGWQDQNLEFTAPDKALAETLHLSTKPRVSFGPIGRRRSNEKRPRSHP